MVGQGKVVVPTGSHWRTRTTRRIKINFSRRSGVALAVCVRRKQRREQQTSEFRRAQTNSTRPYTVLRRDKT
ncbi:Protein of unknown function [Gryllus bimaculatus]|nr:Protein of unknown function [Gryllus bimaculatus]